MIEYKLQELELDPVAYRIRELIAENHRPAQHTFDTLRENASTRGFIECARHFAQLGANDPLFICYDVESGLKGKKVHVTFMLVIVFDDLHEYNTFRAAAGLEPLLKPMT